MSKNAGFISSYPQLSSDPATPDSGYSVLYPKTDDEWYVKSPSAAVKRLMANPMTTGNDLIVAGSSGTPGRLGVGSDGEVLTVIDGVIGWAASIGLPAGGTAGQILGKVSSDDYNVAWIPYPTLNLFPGDGILIDGENNISIDPSYDFGGVSNGSKVDITVAGSTWTINANAVTTIKINDAAVTNAKLANSTIGFNTPGTSGTAPNWSSSTTALGAAGTLNIPLASGSGVTAGLVSKANYDAWQAKQDALVSGVSIKTINGTNILTSGDLVIAAGISAVSALGSTPNANGASISGSNLTLQPASASFGGIVTTGPQFIAGQKSFTSPTVNFKGYSPITSAAYKPTERTPASVANGKYNAFGITDIFPNGNLVIVYAEASGHIISDGVIKMKISGDQGMTWTTSTIQTDPTYGLNAVGGGVTATGRLVVMFQRWDSPNTLDIRVIYSDDEGATWSTPVVIPDEGETVTSPYGKLVKAGNGVLILPWYGFTGGNYTSYITKSTDNGATWGASIAVESNSTDDYTESTFEYLGGNTILGLLRSEISGHEFGQYMSFDNGDTWNDQGDVSWGISGTPAWLNTYTAPNGRRAVVAYYRATTTDIRAIYGYAKDLINNGTAGWDLSSEVTVGTVSPGSSGYINVVHPYDQPFGFGWYYSETTPLTVADMHFVSLPTVTAVPIGGGSGGGGSSQWTDVSGGINYSGGFVGIGDSTPTSDLDVLRTHNGITLISVKNLNSGSSAYAGFHAESNAGAIEFGMNSSTATAYGAFGANDATIYATQSLIFMSDNASGAIRFAANGNSESVRIAKASGINYLNFGGTSGSSDYGFRNNSGTMEYKNSGGSWSGFSGGGGGGGITISDNQIAFGASSSNTVEGSSNFVYDGTTFNIKTSNNTGIKFQEYNSTYYAAFANNLTPGSTNYWLLSKKDGTETYIGGINSVELDVNGVAAVSATSSGVAINAGSNAYTLPTGRGTNTYVLTTDGAGGTSWAAGGGGGSSQWTTVSGGINYSSGNVGIGAATPSAFLDMVKNHNGGTTASVKNTTSGTGAYAGFHAESNAGAIELGMNSSTTTAYGSLAASDATIYATQAISIMSDNASGIIKFAANGNAESFRIAKASGINYLNFGGASGSSDYGFRNNGGTMEYKNSGGSWAGFSGGGGGSGTVTSVSASVPSFLSISGSPVTTTGTLAISYSGTALPVANGGTGLTALGSAAQSIRVNSGATAFEWFTPAAKHVGTPGIAGGTGAGSGASVSISGDDVAGEVYVSAGAGPSTNSIIATITFGTAWGSTPYPVITPATTSATIAGIFIIRVSSTQWQIWAGANALTAVSVYRWTYHVAL